MYFFFFFFVDAIVEFEERLTTSIVRVGELWKLFCGLQNKLRKALLFITKYLNGPDAYFVGVYKQTSLTSWNMLLFNRMRRKLMTWSFKNPCLEYFSNRTVKMYRYEFNLSFSPIIKFSEPSTWYNERLINVDETISILVGRNVWNNLKNI